MSVAKRDRRRYRLENETVDKNMSSCEKSSKSSSAAVGAAANRAAELNLGVVNYDVGLTSTWFEAALLDVSGSPDLPDISMNVTECH